MIETSIQRMIQYRVPGGHVFGVPEGYMAATLRFLAPSGRASDSMLYHVGAGREPGETEEQQKARLRGMLAAALAAELAAEPPTPSTVSTAR